jgi:hypothetical protein
MCWRIWAIEPWRDAAPYSLPLAGGARVGVERRIVLKDSTPILTFPFQGEGMAKSTQFQMSLARFFHNL